MSNSAVAGPRSSCSARATRSSRRRRASVAASPTTQQPATSARQTNAAAPALTQPPSDSPRSRARAPQSQPRSHRLRQLVADPPNVHYPRARGRPQLLAQPASMRVQGAGSSDREVAPDVAEKLLLAENASWVLRKRVQERELLRRQLDSPPAEPHRSRQRVDRELADPEQSLPPPSVGAPEDSADAREQLCVQEWLIQMIVGSAREAADPVGLPRAAGEDDHGQVRVKARRQAVGRP